MIDISVVLNICFLCFIVATVLHTRVNDKDTCTVIFCFIWLQCIILSLFYTVIKQGGVI